MATQTTALKLVKQFASDVAAAGLPLDDVYLFGSFAKNKQRRFSDIDVALVSNRFNGFLFQDIDHFIDVKIRKPYSNIQVTTFSTTYFKKGDPFIDEIKRTGIKIRI